MKVKEIPYVELTKAMEDEIENLGRHTIQYDYTEDINGFTKVNKSKVKFKRKLWDLYSYKDDNDYLVGEVLVNGPTSIVRRYNEGRKITPTYNDIRYDHIIEEILDEIQGINEDEGLV